MAAFPVLELNHPTLLNLIAIGCYTIAMLFHVISFTTDNWSYMRLEGIPWKMGLWRGCKQHADKSWNCTSAVFDDKVFQTGMSSDWHSGTQVMMTLALIALFLLEFAIICYVCIKRMEVHRDRVTGVVLGLSLTAGGCDIVTLLLVAIEVNKDTGSTVEWSYGIVILSLLFLIISVVCVRLDAYERHKQKGSMRKSTDAVNAESTINTYQSGSFMVAGAVIFRNGGHIPNSSDYGVGWSLQLDIVSGVIIWVTGIVICVDRVRVKRGQQQTFCHFLTLIMYGSEVAKIPEAYVLGSYALVVLCMLFEIAIPVLVLFDKSKRFPSDHVFIVTHVKRKANAARKSKPEPEVARRSEHRQEEPPDGEPGHHRISMSTRGPETLKKFAPYIIEDHAPSIARTSKEFRWSTPSLADGRRRDSSGSSASHNTQTTMFTNVSYDMSVDRDSVESLV